MSVRTLFIAAIVGIPAIVSAMERPASFTGNPDATRWRCTAHAIDTAECTRYERTIP